MMALHEHIERCFHEHKSTKRKSSWLVFHRISVFSTHIDVLRPSLLKQQRIRQCKASLPSRPHCRTIRLTPCVKPFLSFWMRSNAINTNFLISTLTLILCRRTWSFAVLPGKLRTLACGVVKRQISHCNFLRIALSSF